VTEPDRPSEPARSFAADRPSEPARSSRPDGLSGPAGSSEPAPGTAMPGAAFAPPSAPEVALDCATGAAPALERLSLNQISVDRVGLPAAAAACLAAGIGWLGVWRHKLVDLGAPAAARLVRDAGLRVSSLCRGGMFPAATRDERQRRLDDNRRAIDEAAELGTDVLCLVCGPAPDRDLDGARRMVDEGIVALLPYARERGVRLGVEPLHPAFAADRSVVVTLRQANEIVERVADPSVGLIVDAYHVWWDPELYAQISRSSGRILGFHASDWAPGVADPFLGRQLPGDGVIELRRMRLAVEAAGYAGPIEVELINPALWALPTDELVSRIRERYTLVV
jgi:sugar phosphate isomerase/epimerase